MKIVDIIYRYEARDTSASLRPSHTDAALRRLEDGNKTFAALFGSTADQNVVQCIVPVDSRELGLSSNAGEGPKQHPFAVILGCSDARVPIELIFNEGPNDLFVIRVAGNSLGHGGPRESEIRNRLPESKPEIDRGPRAQRLWSAYYGRRCLFKS